MISTLNVWITHQKSRLFFSEPNQFSQKSRNSHLESFAASFYVSFHLYFALGLFVDTLRCQWRVGSACPSSSSIARRPVQLLWHHPDCLLVCLFGKILPTLDGRFLAWRHHRPSPCDVQQQRDTRHVSCLHCRPDVFLIDVFAFVALCFCRLCQARV